MKLGTQTGSLFNHLYSRYATSPVAGQDCTRLMWTDRNAYKCLSVSEDGTQCTIQRYNPKRVDDGGHFTENQSYEYAQLVGKPITLTLSKKGVWRDKISEIQWDEKAMTEKYGEYSAKWKEVAFASGAYNPHADTHPLEKVVKGITKLKTSYQTYNMLWGIADEYCDPTF